MHFSRSLSLSFGLLALPFAVACGDDAGNSTNPMPTTTTTTTAPVTPTPPPVTPTTPPVTPTTPPVTPTTPPVTPTTPPVTPTTPPVTPTTPPATDTWAAVYPIFQAKCGGGTFCHSAAQMPPQLVGEEATVKPLAEGKVDRIAMRTAVDAASPMPPAGMGIDLTEAERAAITAWAESL